MDVFKFAITVLLFAMGATFFILSWLLVMEGFSRPWIPGVGMIIGLTLIFIAIRL
jgi:hypothetical protein